MNTSDSHGYGGPPTPASSITGRDPGGGAGIGGVPDGRVPNGMVPDGRVPDGGASVPPVFVPGEFFSIGELHAMKLDGALSPVFGEAFRSVADRETCGLRAAALGHHIPAALLRRAAVGQLSAAWVYGCAPPPYPLALLLGLEGKSAQLPLLSGCSLRQVMLAPDEVQRHGGVMVTSPLRTALDVARTAPEATARAVLLAMSQHSVFHCSLERIHQALVAAPHVPGKRRGEDLLVSLLDPPTTGCG